MFNENNTKPQTKPAIEIDSITNTAFDEVSMIYVFTPVLIIPFNLYNKTFGIYIQKDVINTY